MSSNGVAGLVEMAPYPSICVFGFRSARGGSRRRDGSASCFSHHVTLSFFATESGDVTGCPRPSDAARGRRSARARVARAEGTARCRPARARCVRTPWISPSSSSDSGNAASARTAQIRRSRPNLGAADLRAAFARRSARPPEVLEPRPRSTGVRAQGAAHVDNISRVLARRGVRRASQCGDARSTRGLSTRFANRTKTMTRQLCPCTANQRDFPDEISFRSTGDLSARGRTQSKICARVIHFAFGLAFQTRETAGRGRGSRLSAGPVRPGLTGGER